MDDNWTRESRDFTWLSDEFFKTKYIFTNLLQNADANHQLTIAKLVGNDNKFCIIKQIMLLLLIKCHLVTWTTSELVKEQYVFLNRNCDIISFVHVKLPLHLFNDIHTQLIQTLQEALQSYTYTDATWFAAIIASYIGIPAHINIILHGHVVINKDILLPYKFASFCLPVRQLALSSVSVRVTHGVGQHNEFIISLKRGICNPNTTDCIQINEQTYISPSKLRICLDGCIS